ncbi:MAG TPA: PIN domain-containing protein [Candidatus Wunengus sp. YC65]|uniref:PIN domain-containing protein n=1 Tax=Candidatus Wunengus sp. YC65 TaxID=3367701 RepID=UPI004029A240
MDIVLDANILIADLRLTGGAFKVFFEGLPSVGGHCCLPEIVLDEVIGHHKHIVVESASTFEKALAGWEKVSLSKVSKALSDSDIERVCAEYKEFLSGRLKQGAITIQPYPEISHKTVVQWAIDRRKPFNQSGTGYRDALIWETVISLKKKRPTPTILITANYKDFGKSPNFHADLIQKIPHGIEMALFNSLEEFNSARIIPQLEQLKEMMFKLQNDTFDGFSLNDWAKGGIRNLLNDFETGFDFVGLQQGHGSSRVSRLVGHGSFIVDDVRLLPSGDFLVSANVDVKADVSVDADDEDCERYDDVREFFGGYVGGSVSTNVEEDANIALTLTLTKGEYSVDSAELDEFSGIVSYTINPHKRRQA